MCLVLELIIQVSDQPVAPSLGLTTSTGTGGSAVLSRLVMTSQVVPMTASLLVNASICFV